MGANNETKATSRPRQSILSKSYRLNREAVVQGFNHVVHLRLSHIRRQALEWALNTPH